MAEEPVLDLCDCCGGDGVVYYARGGRNDPDDYRTERCGHCDGTGFILRDGQEIDVEDVPGIELAEYDL